MRDRPKPTPATEPPREREPDADLPALREVYACQLRREERDKLEGLCASALELTREADTIARTVRADCGLHTDLTAAAVDLRYVERYLRWVGANEGNLMSRGESRLCDLAERQAERIAEIASELEAAAEPRE